MKSDEHEPAPGEHPGGRSDTHGTTAESAKVRDLFFERYREAGIELPGQWNDTLTSILSHKSVRRYLPDPLPPGTLELIVAAAQSAPTSSNLQVWSVVAVEDPARKQRLSKLAGDQPFIAQCPLFLVWLADLHRLKSVAAERHAPAEGLDYLEAFVLGVVDATLAAQNAVVALESIGLGTVYIGAVRNKPEAIAAELGLPPLTMPVFGMCVGRPDPVVENAVKPRLLPQAVLHRERYDWSVQREPIARYDDRMAEFRRGQGLDPAGWTTTATQRIGTRQALHGRDRLREILKGFGFELR